MGVLGPLVELAEGGSNIKRATLSSLFWQPSLSMSWIHLEGSLTLLIVCCQGWGQTQQNDVNTPYEYGPYHVRCHQNRPAILYLLFVPTTVPKKSIKKPKILQTRASDAQPKL